MTVVERVAERLAHGVRGWMALVATLLFAVFTAMVLPDQAEAGAFYTVSYPAPDTSLWYWPGDCTRRPRRGDQTAEPPMSRHA